LFLETWLTWLANHFGLGSVKHITGVKKDLIDTKKVKLEIDKLQDEAEKRDSLVVPATFEDVKEYDPKYNEIRTNILLQENLLLRETVNRMFDALETAVELAKDKSFRLSQAVLTLFAVLHLILNIIIMLILLFGFSKYLESNAKKHNHPLLVVKKFLNYTETLRRSPDTQKSSDREAK